MPPKLNVSLVIARIPPPTVLIPLIAKAKVPTKPTAVPSHLDKVCEPPLILSNHLPIFVIPAVIGLITLVAPLKPSANPFPNASTSGICLATVSAI